MASNSDQINSEHKTSFWLINTNKPIDLECKLFITKENQASTLKDESWKFWKSLIQFLQNMLL